MAITRCSSHVRSSSWPPTSHPLNATIEDILQSLRVSQAGSSSSSSISLNLCNIKNLYEQIDNLIHLPYNQTILSHEPQKREVEEILDGSLVLLDASSSALDALSQMKESILNLKSALRRGSNDEGINSYVTSRKKISKMLSKSLANLKKAEKSCALIESQNTEITLKNLKEAESNSLSTLNSLLSYMIGKKDVSQRSGWSLVSKFVNTKHKYLDFKTVNELETVDYALSKNTEIKVIMPQLQTLEMVMYELENGLESVSKCLIKLRVSLLNVLNN